MSSQDDALELAREVVQRDETPENQEVMGLAKSLLGSQGTPEEQEKYSK